MCACVCVCHHCSLVKCIKCSGNGHTFIYSHICHHYIKCVWSHVPQVRQSSSVLEQVTPDAWRNLKTAFFLFFFFKLQSICRFNLSANQRQHEPKSLIYSIISKYFIINSRVFVKLFIHYKDHFHFSKEGIWLTIFIRGSFSGHYP